MINKAAFRAIRESVGMTQQTLADELGVEVRSVKRWEREYDNGWYQPPQDAWDVLRAAQERQRQAVETALGKVDEIDAAVGRPPVSVALLYWLSEDDYLAFSTDAAHGVAGDWRMANANARAVAVALNVIGVDVEWRNGADGLANQ